MESLSFDGLVELYDKTRVFDQTCFDSALDFLTERFPPHQFGSVIEPGVGTGRVAIPLAERGYRVMGVDISSGMLAALKQRLAEYGKPLNIAAHKVDARDLPFDDGAFDVAVVVHLFYFIRDWQEAADEILRVVRDDGAVVIVNTGTGAEIPFVNERYKELCAARGCAIGTLGARTTQDVVNYYVNLGCDIERVRDRWKWTSRIRLDEALHYIRSRAYTFTVQASDSVHNAVVDVLEVELSESHGGMQAEVEVPCQISVVIISRR